jgi:hypothetical protein
MARCYLFALSESSSHDQATNNWSLHNLLERVALLPGSPAPGGNIVIPVQLHAHWLFDPSELGGQQFEWRFVVSAANQQQQQHSRILTLTTQKQFHRHRITGFPILLEGETRVNPEWRLNGAAWSAEPIFWPLQVDRQ